LPYTYKRGFAIQGAKRKLRLSVPLGFLTVR
jgi:hypothetical protein